MIKLPINEKELDTIITSIKASYPSLYSKLWAYKVNVLIKEKKDGLP